MNEIILQGISKEELIDRISSEIISRMETLPNDNSHSTPRLKDRREAAEYLNISERGLDSLTKDGKIKYSKIGGVVRFKQSELDAFINKNEVNMKKYKT